MNWEGVDYYNKVIDSLVENGEYILILSNKIVFMLHNLVYFIFTMLRL